MKIVHIIESISRGGAEILACNLSIAQNKLNNNVFIISLFQGKDKKYEEQTIISLKRAGVTIIRLHYSRSKILNTVYLHRTIRKIKPHIINTHLQTVSIYTAIACLGINTNIIQTFHSTKIKYHIIQKLIIRMKLVAVIAISHEVYNKISDMFKLNGIEKVIIHNGVDLRKFRPDYHKVRKNIIKIIAIGNLTDAKNYYMLIDAYEQIKSKLGNDTPECSIVGEGYLRKELTDQIITKKLKKYIHLLGYRDDIPELLNNSDIFVMTSAWEGLSIALIEATSCGLPAIVTDVGSNALLVHNEVNGYVVESGNADEFAYRLISLINDKDLMREMGRQSVNIGQLYDIENTAAEYMQLYVDVSGNKKSEKHFLKYKVKV